MNPSAGLNQVLITSDDYSPVVNIIAVLFLILSGVAVAGRTVTKLSTRHAFVLEDAFIVSAFVISAAQTAAMIYAANTGLGRRDASSHDARAETAFHASGFFFITAIVLSKCSLAVFMRSLVPVKSHRWFGNAIIIICGAWWLASIIVHGLECSLVDAWQSPGRRVCYDLAFWDSVGVISILTDAIVIIWPVSVVARLRLPLSKRLFAVACFSTRLLALASMAVQLAVQQQLKQSRESLFDIWQVAMVMQITQSLSIVTASTPHLTTFFGSLTSGMFRVGASASQRTSTIRASSTPSRRSPTMMSTVGEPLSKSRSLGFVPTGRPSKSLTLDVKEVPETPTRPTLGRVSSAPATSHAV